MCAQAFSVYAVVHPSCFNGLRYLFTAVLLALVSSIPGPGYGQSSYSDFTNTIHRLSAARTATDIDELWNALVSSSNIPLVVHDSVAFLYRGPARSVSWIGDFNGWGQSKTFAAKPARIKGTDIWILKASLPSDARVDYKVLINDNEQILDPHNPLNQWSGVGGGSLNSELRMPEWKEDQFTREPLPGTPRGTVVKDLVFNSSKLGYQITYSVYTPPEWHQHETYPVVYVTDGYEYMHERMGNMPAILDNLIHAGRIEPVMAVFIDHRQPVDRTNNRRMTELGTNDKFSAFIITELIPHVEASMKGEGNVRRGIVGTSMGGLTATWLSFTNPDIFHVAGVQSPTLVFKSDIYSICERSVKKPERIFLSTGLIHDAEESVRKLKAVLERIDCNYEYKAVNQGHSWGNWRDLIDDMLIYLFPQNGAQ